MRRLLPVVAALALLVISAAPAEGADDVTAPTIWFESPRNNQPVGRDTHVTAQFTCDDEVGGSGISSCTGSVPLGHEVSTWDAGPQTLTVTAIDNADKLLGGPGRDLLLGRRNFDRCWGGDGADRWSSCEVRRGLP